MAELNDGSAALGVVSGGLCQRCGVEPSSVIDRQLALCGGCYHVEAVKQRRRVAARRPSGNAVIDAIREIERVLGRQIAPCECLDEEP